MFDNKIYVSTGSLWTVFINNIMSTLFEKPKHLKLTRASVRGVRVHVDTRTREQEKSWKSFRINLFGCICQTRYAHLEKFDFFLA